MTKYVDHHGAVLKDQIIAQVFTNACLISRLAQAFSMEEATLQKLLNESYKKFILGEGRIAKLRSERAANYKRILELEKSNAVLKQTVAILSSREL